MLGAIKKSADNFNSQPREGGWLLKLLMAIRPKPFQLTAARRRLGRSNWLFFGSYKNFNSQPREGGWLHLNQAGTSFHNFNSQPREGGWPSINDC